MNKTSATLPSIEITGPPHATPKPTTSLFLNPLRSPSIFQYTATMNVLRPRFKIQEFRRPLRLKDHRVTPSHSIILLLCQKKRDCVMHMRNSKREEYKEKPGYACCVAIVASASLREMIKPGALAIVSPIAVGIAFWIFGYYTGQPILGAKVVASMLMFETVSGILMALFLNTVGGAWDNAKKYIETGSRRQRK